jgi:hypothetical protein
MKEIYGEDSVEAPHVSYAEKVICIELQMYREAHTPPPVLRNQF